MTLLDHFAARAATAQAALRFPAEPPIVLLLDPSVRQDGWLIDFATQFAHSPDRSGRCRRTVRAARGEVVFEFEDPQDARDFRARFC